MLKLYLPLSIPRHPTQEQLDSSKVSCRQRCAREYLLRYVFGWTSKIRSPDLDVGTGVHLSIEHLLKGGSVREAQKIYSQFLETLGCEDAPSPKNESNIIKMLGQYQKVYGERDKQFEVLGTEIGGTVCINHEKDRHMSFRIDAIVRDKNLGKVLVLDHKTTKQDSRMWRDGFKLSTQLSLYTHVLYYYYKPEDVYGARVNGLILRKGRKATKAELVQGLGDEDGIINGNDFVRLPVVKSPEMMRVWLWEINEWIGQLEKDFEALSACSPDDDILKAFPKNPNSCTKWKGCPFHHLCVAGNWSNPLRFADSPPEGFKVEWWNPLADFEGKKEELK